MSHQISERRHLAARLGILAVFAIALNCERRSEPPRESREAKRSTTLVAPIASVSPSSEDELLAAANRAAENEIARVVALPALPGAPGFEKVRAAVVARAKSEPVFFIRTPTANADQTLGTRSVRKAFENTDFPWREFKRLRRKFVNRQELARQLLLKEGYLYSERANHAFSLVSLVRPTHLFDEPEFWVQRGETLMHAKKADDQYYFRDGPEEGKRVRLLHLDRVGTGPVPPPLHRDFRALRYQLFFERAKVRHITEEYLVADLRYGKHWIPTVLRSRGAHLERIAELVAPQIAAELKTTREHLELEVRLVSKLRNTMREQIDEGLPFDEPKTEDGQQDGALRRVWRAAYLRGQNRYIFNDDAYDVFDETGRPKVPQVCIDFMVDTFERSSGRWWKPKTAGQRGVTDGKLDLSIFGKDELRRTKRFLSFAREHEDWFDVLTFPKHMRVELGYKKTFFRWLEKNSEHFRPGDIILIRGVTPWDDVDEHTHSFFIYESDAMTGMPIAIAGNAGPANLWSWETEARRTPNRTVRTRIRPKVNWLQSFITFDSNEVLDVPALVSGKK